MPLVSKRVRTIALAALIAAIAVPTLAQQKIGVIDVTRLMTESKRGKDVMTKLEELQAEKRVELQSLNDEVLLLQKQYTEGRLSLAEDKLAQLEAEIERKGRAFERAREDAELDMQKLRDGDVKRVENDVLPIIRLVGEELGFSLIFNKFQSGLVYASDAVDITDVILERYDATVGE